MAWKKNKQEEKEKEMAEKVKQESKKTGGKGLNILNGRALFQYDPSLFQDDLGAVEEDAYEEEEEESKQEETKKEAAEKDKDEGVEGAPTNGDVKVDENLFLQEGADGQEEEEPDFG